ncbi:MAG: DUF4279 domain-containing protein [Lachnospiraceae bacterium]|nr:DUF4279 domain-containing protein [Lachnospiraceae bacterium]
MEFPLENLLNKNTAHTNIRASLRILGEYFDVQKITDALEVAPSCTWNKGEFIRDSGKKRTYTAWIYKTEIIETLDINASVKQIGELFYSKVDNLVGLRKQYELDISIDFVIVIKNEEPPAIYFEPDFIRFAAKIGAQFDVDTYIN